MRSKKININELRKIIESEMRMLSEQSDDVDHVKIREVVSSASDLLEAISEFVEGASPACINAVTPHLDNLKKTLKDMVSTPGSYVEKQKPMQKKVSLRSVKA